MYRAITILITLSMFLLIVGCEIGVEPVPATEDSIEQEAARLKAAAYNYESYPAPDPLVTVGLGSESLTLWPFTGSEFTSQGHDPINLIFVGEADPRNIMAALMSLDGDRTALGMPDQPPFNCRWTDAIGDVQASYCEADGWTPGVIQLECGDFQTARFHLRLFKMGNWTVANCHFEVLIPGTTDHQVLSWELAEQFVTGDFMRSQLLDETLPMMPSGPINPTPSYRTIPAVIYNELPIELQMLVTGQAGDVTEDVPIATDGEAMIFNLANKVDWQADSRNQDFVINFGQVIPKPFCLSGPYDYLLVQGPVHLTQTVDISKQGTYRMSFRASGELTVAPYDVIIGEVVGEPLPAKVFERHNGTETGYFSTVTSLLYQKILPASEEEGRLFKMLRVDSRGNNYFYAFEECESE
ncbi:MAG: hypothetical protein V3V99_04335 [candidate division Zixibacteria bacterium]